jgi:hypothetical protein
MPQALLRAFRIVVLPSGGISRLQEKKLVAFKSLFKFSFFCHTPKKGNFLRFVKYVPPHLYTTLPSRMNTNEKCTELLYFLA